MFDMNDALIFMLMLLFIGYESTKYGVIVLIMLGIVFVWNN